MMTAAAETTSELGSYGASSLDGAVHGALSAEAVAQNFPPLWVIFSTKQCINFMQ